MYLLANDSFVFAFMWMLSIFWREKTPYMHIESIVAERVQNTLADCKEQGAHFSFAYFSTLLILLYSFMRSIKMFIHDVWVGRAFGLSWHTAKNGSIVFWMGLYD